VCTIVFLSMCRTKMSPRPLKYFCHTSFCYGGGCFWAGGLCAARWEKNVNFTENIRFGTVRFLVSVSHIYLFLVASLQLVFLERTK